MTDKATGVVWGSDPEQTRFGQVVLRHGARSVVWQIERFDEVRSTPGSLSLVTRPLVDGKPTGVSVTFTATPLTEPAGLQLAYDSSHSADWRVTGVRLLDRALVVTEADGGRVYVPHRLGIERPAESGFPGSESWTKILKHPVCGDSWPTGTSSWRKPDKGGSLMSDC